MRGSPVLYDKKMKNKNIKFFIMLSLVCVILLSSLIVAWNEQQKKRDGTSPESPLFPTGSKRREKGLSLLERISANFGCKE